MKKISVKAIFALFTTLALLASFIPASPVQAAAEISITPEEGEIGERIVIIGNEFNRSTETSDKYAAIYFSSQEATVIDDIGSDVIVYEQVKEWVPGRSTYA